MLNSIFCAALLASASLFDVASAGMLERMHKHMSRRAAYAEANNFHRPQLDERSKSKFRFLTPGTASVFFLLLPEVGFGKAMLTPCRVQG
jgi:hypothetical protein